jgi:ubiquinone/menaquinone biosynthesis C-methylase UbiE
MSEHAFDAGASGYDQIFSRVTQALLPDLIGAADLKPGERVLDVATGTGGVARAAAEIVAPAGYVIATDLSVPMLKQARLKSGAVSMSLAAMDGQSLAFRTGIFDAVLCQLGLMFFPAPERGAAEFLRILRSGGRAVISVTSADPKRTLYNRVNAAIARQQPNKSEPHQRLLTLGPKERLQALLSEAGFRCVEVDSRGYQFGFKSFEEFFGPVEAGSGSVGQLFLALPNEARGAVRDEVYRDLLGGSPDSPFVIDMEILTGSGFR